MAHKGTTGRFYCGKNLDYKCGCCNGKCGPTNGCNCTSCKKLDLQFLMPTKGITGKYYCGRKVLKCKCCNGYCGPTSGCNCTQCQQYQKKQQQQKLQFNKQPDVFNMASQSFQKMYASHLQKSNQNQYAKIPEVHKAQSQIVLKKKYSEEVLSFKNQLQQLNLSDNTIDILLDEEINSWEILNQIAKEDLTSLKIKLGDVMRIMGVRK